MRRSGKAILFDFCAAGAFIAMLVNVAFYDASEARFLFIVFILFKILAEVCDRR